MHLFSDHDERKRHSSSDLHRTARYSSSDVSNAIICAKHSDDACKHDTLLFPATARLKPNNFFGEGNYSQGIISGIVRAGNDGMSDSILPSLVLNHPK